MLNFEELKEYLGFLGSKAFYFFYENSFSKQTRKKNVKNYVKKVLNLWSVYSAPLSVNIDSNNFFVPQAQILGKTISDLTYLFAVDITKQSKHLVLYEPFDILRLAEIVEKIIKNRSKHLEDIYNMVLPNIFVRVFDNKGTYGLTNSIPIFSYEVYKVLLNVSYNLANGMAILGEINKKYWDDAYLELSMAGFVLEAYYYIVNQFLEIKNYKYATAFFHETELLDLLDINSTSNNFLNLTKNTYKSSKLYYKLNKFFKALDTIKYEYEKQAQKN